MVYLHFTFIDSYAQNQDYTTVDCHFLINGDKWDTYCYCQNIELLAFDWCIYNRPWPTLKVNVKVMHILAVNISYMVTQDKIIVITNK